MSGFHPFQSLKKADGSTIGKWACVIGAGILTLFATLFDTKCKDRQYEQKMDKAIAKQAAKLLEKADDAEG